MIYIIMAIIVGITLIGCFIDLGWANDSHRLYKIIQNKYNFLHPDTIDDLIEVFGFATKQQRRRIFFYLDSNKFGKLRALLNKYLKDYDNKIHID